MALHLVTGYKGTPHITAEDVGSFNAGILGSGEYVMNLGNKFAASLTTSNTVRVLDGDLVIQGRHVSLKKDTYEELTINNGEAGKNRNDLIVVRYTKDGTTGEENAVFAVIQGISTEDTATDPEYTTGDILSGNCILHEMPLYRITLSGLTVGEPEKLFNVVKRLEDVKGLIQRGEVLFPSVDNDTAEWWATQGSGMWTVSDVSLIGYPFGKGSLYAKPGKILNFVAEDSSRFWVTQIFFSYMGAAIRYGYSYRNKNGFSWTENWSIVQTRNRIHFKQGSYSGDDNFGSNGMTILPIAMSHPAVVIVRYNYSQLIWVQGMEWAGWVDESGDTHSVSTSVSTDESGNDIFCFYSSQSAKAQMNVSGAVYYWCAIGAGY